MARPLPIPDQVRVDLARVERRRKLLAEAEARLAKSGRLLAETHGYRVQLTEPQLRRLIDNSTALRAVA